MPRKSRSLIATRGSKLRTQLTALAAVDELAARFQARLTVLQQADAGGKVKAVFAARGKLARRPGAGAAF